MSSSHLHSVRAAPEGQEREGANAGARRGRVVLVLHPDRETREIWCELLEAQAQIVAPVADAATAAQLAAELEACGAEAVVVAVDEAQAALPRAPRERAHAGRSSAMHVCSWCKRLRQPDGTWRPAHLYEGAPGSARSGGAVTHGICADCYTTAVAQLVARRLDR